MAKKKDQQLSPSPQKQIETEPMSFDDALRKILSAPPKHRKAKKEAESKKKPGK